MKMIKNDFLGNHSMAHKQKYVLYTIGKSENHLVPLSPFLKK